MKIQSISFLAGVMFLVVVTGCDKPSTRHVSEGGDASDRPAEVVDASADQPCVSKGGPCVAPKPGDPTVTDSNKKVDLSKAALKEKGRMLWANSFLWNEAPKLEMETWLSEKPDTKGKFVLVEFWNTWCPPCRKSLKLLNEFHAKYKDELVVIGVCDESKEAIEKMLAKPEHQIDFYHGIDSQARMKKALGVWAVPHAILIEPNGIVIWEGFPLQKGYQLTGKIIERALEIGRKEKAAKAAEKK